MGVRKYRTELREIVEAVGLHFERFENGKHLKIHCREGTIVAAATPSDSRNLRNIAAIARRLASSL